VCRRRGDPDVGGAPAFELVDDRDERLLARERDVARVRLALLGGRAGYPAGQCSSGARCSVVFIRLLTWVFDEFVEPVVDLACVAVFHEPAKPIADVLEAVFFKARIRRLRRA